VPLLLRLNLSPFQNREEWEDREGMTPEWVYVEVGGSAAPSESASGENWEKLVPITREESPYLEPGADAVKRKKE
jgi:hypothetical protein